MLYMFRTVLVHHQEQLYKLYIAFGICQYHTCGCCVAIATQQLMLKNIVETERPQMTIQYGAANMQ